MNLLEIDSLVDVLISQGKSLDEIVNELAIRKCYYSLVEMVLVKKKLEGDIVTKIKSHEYHSEQSKTKNPFTEEFIKHLKKD